jgi:hypothetical protein
MDFGLFGFKLFEFKFFEPGSYENYDEPRTREEYDDQYPHSDDAPEPEPDADTRSAKCGGTGHFRGHDRLRRRAGGLCLAPGM